MLSGTDQVLKLLSCSVPVALGAFDPRTSATAEIPSWICLIENAVKFAALEDVSSQLVGLAL